MRYVLVMTFFLLVFLQVSAQQDTIYSSTGDRVIGEIKSMSKSVLTFDTDYADSEFKIEWGEVKSIASTTHLSVYIASGERYTGYLKMVPGEEGKVRIYDTDVDKVLALEDIVKINTVSTNFWDRIYISIDAGYSYTKAQNLSQLSTAARVTYTTEKWRFSGTMNNVLTKQDNVGTTKRNESTIDVNRDLYKRLFLFAGLEFLQSSEQNLDLRTTSKLGIGYYFIRENGMYFQGGLGLANTNENYGAPDNITKNSFEGLTGLEFDAYDIGDISFRAKVTAFPSFSNSGRVRINSDVSAKWDLPLDFYIKVSFIHNYDSKPQVVDVDKGDYVFQTSIGWEWD